MYEMSIEHHVRNEIVLNHVANWELLAPQTEEEYGESQKFRLARNSRLP